MENSLNDSAERPAEGVSTRTHRTHSLTVVVGRCLAADSHQTLPWERVSNKRNYYSVWLVSLPENSVVYSCGIHGIMDPKLPSF